MEPDGSASAAELGAGPEAVTDDKSPSSQEQSTQEDDLRRSVAALGTLASRELDLEQLLTRVAQFAVRAIPAAEGAGLTLIQLGRPNTVVVTADFVRQVDDIQYTLMQGPCVSAAADGRTVLSGSLGSDRRWPRFGSKVARLGVHSAVSLPLITSDGVVGAMNVYAHAKHAFDDHAAVLGEAFAGPAAIAVQNAAILAQALRLAEHLEASQRTRGIVDRAVGMLMSRSGDTEHDALERLRAISRHEERKLVDVAQQIIDETVRRARRRRDS
ncbi:GAF domain-containing protein [Friedmanniella luteola]|uniref:GAF domain-containing protein n=1 Tax=Friedmanniella luteola TaxID=546871 RepID=A0A1H1RQI9_9ACTN|nr:GAF and ANTAR domain-containing protein [Friedmanniella luteola]SDS37816.1 GAF domain-containing protein [Friedmanniella luteola]